MKILDITKPYSNYANWFKSICAVQTGYVFRGTWWCLLKTYLTSCISCRILGKPAFCTWTNRPGSLEIPNLESIIFLGYKEVSFVSVYINYHMPQASVTRRHCKGLDLWCKLPLSTLVWNDAHPLKVLFLVGQLGWSRQQSRSWKF